MGRIYINPKTGEIWEARLRNRKPPEGFVWTGYKIDYRFHRSYYAETYLCPKCGVYHCVVKIDVNRDGVPLHIKKKVELGERLGCEDANKIVDLAVHIGGKKVHYDKVVALREMGLLDRWYDKLTRLEPSVARKAIDKLLRGESEDDVRQWLILMKLKG